MSISAPRAGASGNPQPATSVPAGRQRLRLVARRVTGLHADPLLVVRALAGAAGTRRLAVLSGAWTPGTVLTADPSHTRELVDPAPNADLVRPLLAALDEAVPAVARAPGTPRQAVGGGWVVLLGHAVGGGTGRVRVPPPAAAGPALPAAVLAWHDHVLRHDGAAWWAEALDDGGGQAVQRALALAEEAVAAVGPASRSSDRTAATSSRAGPHARLAAVPDQARHLRAVERCVTAIRAGEIAQANVCTRFSLHLNDGTIGAVAAWLALVEELQPARGALVTGPWGALVSASPELYLKLTPTGPARLADQKAAEAERLARQPGGRVSSAPIKGTQPLGQESALASSAKDAAENVMIVDLLRNDLSRVCRPGTVEVPALLRVESHAGVAHLVSRVEGEVEPTVGAGGVIAATFPPASVTGTPKQRATELTNGIESAARGAHTGAVGLISPRLTELAVVIRSLEVAPDGEAALGVGGGIVADSTPAEEWAEVLTKAAPLLSALGIEPPAPTARTAGSKGLANPAAGLIDTVLVVDGRAVEAAGHTARLRRSYWEAYRTALRADVDTLLAEQVDACGPGVWRARLHADTAAPERVTIALTPWQPPLPVEEQAGLVLAVRPAPEAGLERHKYADRTWLAGQLAEVHAHGADDVALVAPHSRALLETTRSCLFAVVDGRLVTAPTDGQILPGVTRQVLVDLALDAGVAVDLTAPSPELLRRAAGLLAVNALRGVEWVRSIGTVGWTQPDPVTRQLGRALLTRWQLR